METTHLPMLVLVLERKAKEKKRKRAGSAGGESSRPRMDRARRQAGGGMPAEAALVGPRGMPMPAHYRDPRLPPSPVVPAAAGPRGLPLPVQRGPGFVPSPVVSPADAQRLRLQALQRARGGI
jgi:hypothetical protein